MYLENLLKKEIPKPRSLANSTKHLKKKITPILLLLENKRKGNTSKLTPGVRITVIAEPDKDSTRKENDTNILHEPQQNININSNIPLSTGVYPENSWQD